MQIENHVVHVGKMERRVDGEGQPRMLQVGQNDHGKAICAGYRVLLQQERVRMSKLDFGTRDEAKLVSI